MGVTVEVVTAVLLIVLPIAFNAAFFALGAAFDYPDILRREPDEVLRRFHAGGAGLILRWEAFISAVLDLAEKLSVRLTIGLDAIPMAVPHTRPAGVTAHATRQELIAEHRLSAAKGAMVIEPGHYAKLPRRSRTPKLASPSPAIELPSGPGVGLHYVAPEVEFRPLSIYNAFCEEVAHVASV